MVPVANVVALNEGGGREGYTYEGDERGRELPPEGKDDKERSTARRDVKEAVVRAAPRRANANTQRSRDSAASSSHTTAGVDGDTIAPGTLPPYSLGPRPVPVLNSVNNTCSRAGKRRGKTGEARETRQEAKKKKGWLRRLPSRERGGNSLVSGSLHA